MIGIGIANSLGVNLSGLSPAAKSFVTAAGISDPTKVKAINDLVIGLQSSGLWSKMKAVYPFVTDNRNLMSYTQEFDNATWQKAGGTVITANSTTAPDGTLTADTFDTNQTKLLWQNISAANNTAYTFSAWVKLGTATNLCVVSNNTLAWNTISGQSFNASNGLNTSTWTRISFTFTTPTLPVGTCNIHLGGNAQTGLVQSSGTVFIWGAQLELGSTATSYQPIATTQQAFISNQFKYNLKDPRDLDAAFRLVFNGGWSFSSTGATPNGVNGYADTKLSTSSLTNNSTHISYYSRSATSGSTRSEIGVGDPTTNVYLQMLAYRLTGNYNGDQYYGAAALNRIDVAVANSIGYFVDSRINTTTHKAWRSNVLIGSENNLQTNNISSFSQNIYIGGRNNGGSADLFSDRQAAFATIGDGLTDDDATNLYYYTQVFQTTLGRQVGSPAYALPTTYDASAKLYLSAIGSTTDSTLNNAVDTFIKGLKADGIYSKMKAVYPFATDNRNLLSYTEDFGNAAWFKQSTTVTTNTSTAPNGTLTADTALFSSSTPSFVRASTIPITSGQTYTISVYVKKSASSGANNIRITTNDTLAWNTGITQKFSLTTSWQRITLTGVINSSVNVAHIIFGSTNLDGTVDATCGGNVDMWGAQLELGSTATTYQPILGSQQSYISNQFKYNMVNPQDDDSAFRLVFNGGWTHSANGATPNGTNGYADTKLNENTVMTLNNIHMSFYSRTNSTIASCDIGCLDTSTLYGTHIIPYSSGNAAVRNTDLSSGFTATANTLGLFINSRISSAQTKYFYNSTLFNTIVSSSISKSNQVYFLGARNTGGTASSFSPKQLAFSSIGDGLTDTESANLYTRVQTFNQTLSRQVGVPIVSDSDAQAFLNSAEITDITQANAINNLVIDLKAHGLWSKMKAVYPFVGGTASSHKFNLKDPRDLDAAYRLVFNGGWTHSSTGATPNGTNGYADTKLIPSSSLSTSSAHFAKYNRTNDLTGVKIDGACTTLTSPQLFFQHNYTSANAGIGDLTSLASYTPTDTRGLFNATRTATNALKVFRNTTNIASNTTSITTLPNRSVYLGARSIDATNADFYNTYQNAFTSIGDGLTDAESLALYNVVNNYQVALSRNV